MQIVGQGGSTILAAYNTSNLYSLPAGPHQNNVQITESDPVYGAMTYTLPVVLNVSENLVVTASALTLGNCTGPQTVYVTNGGPFTVAVDQSWLSVAASAYNTNVPATLTFSYGRRT